jgi:DNA-binding NarL/FixJ family response regulator
VGDLGRYFRTCPCSWFHDVHLDVFVLSCSRPLFYSSLNIVTFYYDLPPQEQSGELRFHLESGTSNLNTSVGAPVVTILVFDRQSLFQMALLSLLRQEHSEATHVVACTSEPDLAQSIEENPGAIVFLGQTSLPSRLVTRAGQQSCSIVWITEHRNEYLPLLTQPAIKGIMFRTATPEQLTECLTAIHSGQSWIQPTEPTPEDPRSAVEKKLKFLTPKERVLAAYLLDGKDNHEIAGELGYKEGTVKNMIMLVYDKLGVNKRHEFVKALLSSPPTCQAASMNLNNFTM